MVDWITLDPSLHQEDLRPYFYFAREEIGALSGPSRRMSRGARAAFARLTSRAEVDRIAGANQLEALSESDASAVFEAVAGLVRRTEDLGAENSPLDALYRVTGAREELVGETVKLLGSLPEANLTAGVPPRLVRLTRETHAATQAEALLGRWSNSTSNPQLALTAKNMLQRPTSGGSPGGGR